MIAFKFHYAMRNHRGLLALLETLASGGGANAPYIHDPLNPEQFSIQPVLDRETAIIRLAQKSANACASALVPDWPGDTRLDTAQAEAARRILSVYGIPSFCFADGQARGKVSF